MTEKSSDIRYVPRSKINNLKNRIRNVLYLCLFGLVKYLPFPFFDYLRYAVLKLFAAKIQSSYISDGVIIWFPWNVRIGKKVSLNQGVIIDGLGGVNIGDGVRIASYAFISTADHDFRNVDEYIADQGFVCGEVNIEEDVWIGTHVCINKGVTIGKGSVIGSGSVVTKNIPPYSIAVGIPCKVIKKRK